MIGLKNIGQRYRLVVKNLLPWKKGLFLFESDYNQSNYIALPTCHSVVYLYLRHWLYQFISSFIDKAELGSGSNKRKEEL